MANDGAAPAATFLPLDDGAQKSKKRKQPSTSLGLYDAAGKRRSAVLYIGRIPHGFYEDQMRDYFSQFGNVKRLRLSRNKKTGKSKHYAFIEFETPEVAEIVAESMHNYLMFGRMLQVQVVPAEKIHPSLWEGANRKYFVRPMSAIVRKLQNTDKDLEKTQRLVRKFIFKDKKRREKLKEIGYEYPEIEASLAVPKKTVFEAP